MTRNAAADGPGLSNRNQKISLSNGFRQRIAVIKDQVSATPPAGEGGGTCTDPNASEGTYRGNSAAFLHRGYFMTVISRDSGHRGGGIEAWDLSQLDSFANTNKDQNPPRVPIDLRPDVSGMQDTKWNCTTLKMREMHGYSIWRNDIPGDALNGHEYIALQGATGFQIWDITNPVAPDMVKDVVLNYTGYDISGSDYEDGAWWINWVYPYIYVGGSLNGVYVVDARNPLNAAAITAPGLFSAFPNGCDPLDGDSTNNPPSGQSCPPVPKEQFGDLRVNQVTVIGNLMVIGHADGSKFATVDIGSNPRRPTLIERIKATVATGEPAIPANKKCPSSYTYGFAGNAGHLYFYGGDVTPIDVTDGGNMGQIYVRSKTTLTTPNDGKEFLGKVGYFNFKDGFLVGGYSTETGWAKIDVKNNNGYSGLTWDVGDTDIGDEDFATTIGNMVFIGNDHNTPSDHVGSAIYPLAGTNSDTTAPPDSTGPSVNFVIPMANKTGLPTSTRIGVVFSENIDLRSVNANNFVVRNDATGAVIPGAFTIYQNVVNWSPVTSAGAPTTFANNTTYRLDIPAGGVKDWVGNAAGAGFTQKFTIGTAQSQNPDVPPSNCTLTANPTNVQGIGYINPNGTGNNSPTVTFTASCTTGTNSGSDLFQYSFNFDDGTAPTAFTTTNNASHTFTTTKHFNVQVTVKNNVGQATAGVMKTIVNTPTRLKSGIMKDPTHASPIVYDVAHPGDTTPMAEDRIYVVNPDNDSVTSFKATGASGIETGAIAWETNVGRNPRTLAVRPGVNAQGERELWVACMDDATIRVLKARDGTYAGSTRPMDAPPKGIVNLPVGSRPHSVVFSPDGSKVYVTLEGLGQVVRIDPTTYTYNSTTDVLEVGPKPRGLAVTADSQNILVTRLLSLKSYAGQAKPNWALAAGAPTAHTVDPTGYGEVMRISASTFTVAHTFQIAADLTSLDSEDSSRGIVNYLQSVNISPDGYYASIPSKKDNVFRGTSGASGRTGGPLTFDSTSRTVVSIVDLYTQPEPATDILEARRDINNAEMANATAYSKDGQWVIVATQNNRISVYDGIGYDPSGAVDGDESLDDGFAISPCSVPQGVVLSPTDSRLYVWCRMSRTVEVYDTTQLGQSLSFPWLKSVRVQTAALPTDDVFLGKKIFYNSADAHMSHDSYLACATCHLDGGADETVFDFTGGGEGLRNTISLLGRRGMGHGPVHWTANFDEIQDFEHPIRDLFGGTGLMDDADFLSGGRNTPMGSPKANASATNRKVDQLAAYVSSLNTVPRSPYRNKVGTLNGNVLVWREQDGTAAYGNGVTGRGLFASKNCASCHSGRDFTDSASLQLHDVGTILPTTRNRLGGPLPGLDTPTLLGIWSTAPYLHDGQAPTLKEVLSNTTHVGTFNNAQEMQDLAAYLLQIDDLSRDIFVSDVRITEGVDVVNAPGTNPCNNAGAVQLAADEAVNDLAYGDRGYTWSSFPSELSNAVQLRMANDAKFCQGFGVAIDVVGATDVYMAVIDSPATIAGRVPSWLTSGNGWTEITSSMSAPLVHVETSTTVTSPRPGWNDATGTRNFRIFKKSYPSTSLQTITLGDCDNDTCRFNNNASTTNMYHVFMKPMPAAGAAPSAPTSLAATSSSGVVNLSWSASASGSPSTYTVKRSTVVGGGFSAVGTVNAPSVVFADSTVVNGTQYYYMVTATNSFGESVPSNQVSALPGCVGLSAPASPTAVAFGPQVQLGWTAVAGADGYNIKRSTTNGGPYQTIYTASSNGYWDTPATVNTYYYVITATKNGCSDSPQSAQVSARISQPFNDTSNDLPGTIQAEDYDIGGEGSGYHDDATDSSVGAGLTYRTDHRDIFDTTCGTGCLNLGAHATNDWTQYTVNVAMAGTYSLKIRYADTADRAVKLQVDNVDATSAITLTNTASYSTYTTSAGTNVALTAGQHVMRLLVTNGSVNLDWFSLTLPAPTTAPTLQSATAGNSQVALAWTSVSGAYGYHVYRSTSSSGPWTNLVGTTSSLSFTDSSAVNGTTYWYKVAAYVPAAGDGPLSGALSATPQGTLTAPTSVVAVRGNGMVRLTWNAVGGATGYRVKRGTASGNYDTTVSPITPATFDSTGLTNGVTYYYVVSTLNGAAESVDSDEVTATPVDPPAVPTITAAVAGTGQVALTWSASTGATTYKVYRGGTQLGSAITAPTVTMTDSTPTNGTQYTYTVSALTDLSESAQSASAARTPMAAPAAPTVAGGNATVTVTFSAPTGGGQTGYNVKRGTSSSGPFTTVGSPSSSPYPDNTVTNGTTYYYVVSATNSGGESNNSAVSAPVTPAATPTAPSGFAASDGNGSSRLTWTDNSSNETGFKIERKTGAGGTYAQIFVTAANATSYIDSPGSANTYYYRVRATNAAGDSAYATEDPAVIAGASTNNPTNDAFVRDGTYAGTNQNGTLTTMDVKTPNTGLNATRHGYLRINLTGAYANIGLAKIRVYGNAVTAAKTLGVYAVSNLTWTEGTITWNNSSAVSGFIGSQLGTTAVSLTAGYVEVNVTSYIQAQKSAGATQVTFALKSETVSDDGPMVFNTKDNTANKPELIIWSAQ